MERHGVARVSRRAAPGTAETPEAPTRVRPRVIAPAMFDFRVITPARNAPPPGPAMQRRVVQEGHQWRSDVTGQLYPNALAGLQAERLAMAHPPQLPARVIRPAAGPANLGRVVHDAPPIPDAPPAPERLALRDAPPLRDDPPLRDPRPMPDAPLLHALPVANAPLDEPELDIQRDVPRSNVDDIEEPLLGRGRSRSRAGSRLSLPVHAPDYGSIQNDDRPNEARSTARENVFDAITASAPGGITGVTGVAAAAMSAATNVPPRLGVVPEPHLTRLGHAGSAFDGANALVDVLAIGRNVADWREGSRERGADDGSLRYAMGSSKVKRARADLATNAIDLVGSHGTSAWSTGAKIAGAAAPAALSTVGTAAGVGTNAIVFGRNLWRGGRAWKHKSAVDEASQHAHVRTANPEVQAAAAHHSEQMGKRRWRAGVGALGAGLGIAGGIALLAGAGPVGWGLLGAGALVAGALGAYKLGRWAYKKFGQKNTLGEQRNTHANSLVDAMQPGAPPADRQGAEKILKARLGDKTYAKFAAASPEDQKKHLLDKAKSW
jgi:hypothetical protein